MPIEPAIFEKLSHYCAYQERSIADVKTKMRALKIEAIDFDTYLTRLKNENYVNEERYTKAFINGHLRKKWGVNKIKAALLQKGINRALAKKLLEAADRSEYDEALITLAERKLKTIKGSPPQATKQKGLKFLLGKGYEMDKVLAALKKLKIWQFSGNDCLIGIN